ncbi:MAG: hydroxyacid dehydrogenase [Acidobacteriota bacterium]
MKILICDAFDPSLPKRLSKYGEVTEDMSQLPDADIALVRSKTKCTKEFIDQGKNLKMIIRGGVGLDNIDVQYSKTKGIIVQNTAEASSIAVAELAIALMIAIPSKIVEGDGSMKKGQWLKKELKRTELFGKTLGLIGMGRIATEVAKRAKAFGMRVIAYDPYVKSSEYAEMKNKLDDLLAESDYISLHTPITPETEKMINRETIAKMKNGVIIINTARGKCVVEEDVADALKSGKIGGYGNDVWYSDPPQNSPLINAPSVVLMPHLGASTKENLLRIGEIVDRQIGEYIRKQ